MSQLFTGSGWQRCPACTGTGLDDPTQCRCHGGDACRTCGGRGQVHPEHPAGEHTTEAHP